MGVGTPDDIVESVRRGIDMFDCVMPTRAGRHGQVFTRHGRLNLRNARHAEDTTPLDQEAKCTASNTYSRAYLHHLVRSNEILGMMLLTWHNLAYYQELMAGLRKAIGEGRLESFVGDGKEGWAKGERDGGADLPAHMDNAVTAPTE
jgi:queuine tRNA-ribosyltransferase